MCEFFYDFNKMNSVSDDTGREIKIEIKSMWRGDILFTGEMVKDATENFYRCFRTSRKDATGTNLH